MGEVPLYSSKSWTPLRIVKRKRCRDWAKDPPPPKLGQRLTKGVGVEDLFQGKGGSFRSKSELVSCGICYRQEGLGSAETRLFHLRVGGELTQGLERNTGQVGFMVE